MNLKQDILGIADDIYPDLVDIRRHLHQHPELSFQEFETSKFIAQTLDSWGVLFQGEWVKTGIVAEVKGELKGDRTTALRADIDALPIQEIEGRSYRSLKEGVMHACGHDVHTTCLLGAIKILQQTKSKWGGTVKCIFQPGEEKLPGGASLMIEEGLIDYLSAESILGQHVHPPLEVGKVGFHPGSYMASADEIYIEVIGKGGHAALPSGVIDPINAGAHLRIEISKLAEAYHDPKNPIVLSIGKIWSDGGATNVIPNKVFMEGTFRAMDEAKRFEVHSELLKVGRKIADQTQTQVMIEIKKGYPVLYNDPSLTHEVKSFAIELLGEDRVVDLPKRMTSEDFSFYSQVMPGCFYRLGTGNQAKNIVSSVHTRNFDVDEACIKIGSSLMAFSAIKLIE